MRIDREIMEIIEMKSLFLQMTPLFSCGTKNGDGLGNYDETELLMHYIIVTPWIGGCDHNGS